jgi:peptidoglycan-associated lipoprotein
MRVSWIVVLAAALLPAAAQAQAETPAPIKVGACQPLRVHFAFDKSDLNLDAQTKLDKAADCLKDNQRQIVSIQGNTDERGTSEYNQALGERRARAVYDYLSSKGVSEKQLQTYSFGKDNPLCTGSDESCWKHNRRAALEPACRL